MKTQTLGSATRRALFAAAFCAAALPSLAATAIYWKGGSGGTESEPADVYNKNNWTGNNTYSGNSISSNPTGQHNFHFKADSLTYLTNCSPSAVSGNICEQIFFHVGDYSLCGSFKTKAAVNVGADAGYESSVTVNGGSVTVGDALYVGGSSTAGGSGTMTVNGGTIEVNNVYVTKLAVNSGNVGALNLNGGLFKTKGITAGSGNGQINFNGGALEGLLYGQEVIQNSDKLTVTVGANGGTIIASNGAVRVAKTIGGTGRMTFAGTSSINFTENSGDAYWTGGTKVMLGATVQVEGTNTKAALLDNGLVVDGSTQKLDGTFTVLQVKSGTGVTLTDADLDYVSFENCGEGTTKRISDNKIKVDFKVPTQPWELDDDHITWSSLVTEYGTPAPDASVIINAASAYTLTIDTDVTVAQISFTGTNPNVVVNSGSTVTADSISFSGSGTNYLKNDGVVVLNDDTTLPFHNDSRGVYYVNAGRLKVPSVTDGSTTPGLLPEGTNQFVCVASGAMYDVNGVADNTASVRLAAGATIANGGTKSVTTSSKQIQQLILNGDATANVHRSFGLVGANNHSATSLDLGEHTLTITGGGNTYSFFLDNTTVSGTGTILVSEGKFCACQSSSGENFTLEIGPSGYLVIDKAGGGTANTDFTVGNFVNNGTDESTSNGGSLVVKGTLTPGNAIKKLTLADGSTITASATTVQTVSTAFSASGTVTIDASEITKAQLDAGSVAVLTVPVAFNPSGVTWDVTGAAVVGTRAKWRTDEGGTTKTLYICRPTGLTVIFR